MQKGLNILMYALMLVGVLVFVLAATETNMDGILYTSYAYFGVAILITLAGSVMGMARKPENTKNSIIGLVALIVVMGLSYAMSTGDDYALYDTTEGWSAWTDTLLYATLILSIGAIASWVYASVVKMFR